MEYTDGDNWRHKIVLEKELLEYQERFAQVVKFKRNNFQEDPGGVWRESEDDEKKIQKENRNKIQKMMQEMSEV